MFAHCPRGVADAGLRALLDRLTGDAALADLWRAVPCSCGGHHSYRGGLIEHTVGVASLCETLTQWHPRLDSDLLLTSALVHDIGYTRCFRFAATFEPTDEGRLLGHLTIGHEIVDVAARASRLPEERRLALLHAVAWHHGPPGGQAPNGASAEALALWRVNTLEVGVKSRLEGSGSDWFS